MNGFLPVGAEALNVAATVTLESGMVKVYLPFFSVSLRSLSLPSRTVRVSST